eukprot:CAMPEP_0206145226 /NCGR_PEP_ID=MMETSP1473-20131121/26722_1 /ASSEMBLY_ACC=CAM_ASM_001109 /TAXON_ID=1461547 /ORGANISM="Stichococcus sp, Strain RCC1054" /LENGTH=309 /DNA_ID=CAMNT_0053541355 /DNA_START=511 /DNA_END=1437 /DNA_ORIENTATION=+
MPVLGPQLPDQEQHETLPGELQHTLTGHDGPVLAVRFNKPGTYCLSAGRDRTIKLWNPHRGIVIKTYTGHGYDVRDVAVKDDNSQFASAGGDRQLFLWDVSTGQTVRKFGGHDGVINSVAWSPNNEVLVTGGYDQAVKVWDARSRSFHPLQVMRAFADSVTSVTITTDAEILAGSVDGTVRRFDVRAGLEVSDELGAAVTSVTVSGDGLCMLAGCMDGVVRLLDKAGGDLLATYQGHKHASYKLDSQFTPSDSHVLSGSEDGKVYYWDMLHASVSKSFQAHAGPVCTLAMHPEGKLLLTGGTDGAVKVW